MYRNKTLIITAICIIGGAIFSLSLLNRDDRHKHNFKTYYVKLMENGDAGVVKNYMRSIDPKKCAEYSIKQGDYRMLVISSNSWLVPLPENVEVPEIYRGKDKMYWVIPYTTDVIVDIEMFKLKYQFMSDYNMFILNSVHRSGGGSE